MFTFSGNRILPDRCATLPNRFKTFRLETLFDCNNLGKAKEKLYLQVFRSKNPETSGFFTSFWPEKFS